MGCTHSVDGSDSDSSSSSSSDFSEELSLTAPIKGPVHPGEKMTGPGEIIAKFKTIDKTVTSGGPNFKADDLDFFSDLYIKCPSRNGRFTTTLRKTPALKDFDTIADECKALIDQIDTDCSALVYDGSISAAIDFTGGYYRATYDKLVSLNTVLCDTSNKLLPAPLALGRAIVSMASTQIFSTLGYLIGRLVNGRFLTHTEGHGVMIVGSRGSGKTSSLLRLALTACVAFPNLRALYVDCRTLRQSAHPLGSQSLSNVVLERLFPDIHRENLDEDRNSIRPSTQVLLDALERENVYLFLTLDEADELYRHNVWAVQETLGDLEHFATSSFGRVLVVGCGSSCLLHQLVKAVVPEDLHSIFPVAGKVHAMNDTKFAELRLRSPNPMNLEELVPFYRTTAMTIQDRRLVVAKFGTMPRALSKSKSIDLAPLEWLVNSEVAMELEKAYPALNLCLHLLYDLLLARNSKLMERIVNRTAQGLTLNWDALRDTAWQASETPREFTFVPLGPTDVALVWRAYERAVSGTTTERRQLFLNFLCDAGILVSVDNAGIAEIYPVALQVLFYHQVYVDHRLTSTGDAVLALQRLVSKGPSAALSAVLTPDNYSALAKAVSDVMIVATKTSGM